MTDTEKTEYAKLADELGAIAKRLAELSEAGYDDMEITDLPEWNASLALYGLQTPAEQIRKAAAKISAACSANSAGQPRRSEA